MEKEEGWGASLLPDLQFPRHLTEGAGQTKGEGRPVVPDRALEGGRERLGAPPGSQEARPPDPCSAPPLPRPRAPGCGSAPACRCAGSAGLRAGRARSSTPRSRPRCGRRGTEGRKCRTDLGRARGSQSGTHRAPRPPPPRGEARLMVRGAKSAKSRVPEGIRGPSGSGLEVGR